jgi:hypothetical protein
MTKVAAGITTSLDGYITGPNDAPVVLGGGKRLFDDFDETVSLEHLSLLQSPFVTHITYRVVR